MGLKPHPSRTALQTICVNSHKGIFLENGSVYIDSMNLAQQEIHIDASDIVCMYCYICLELKNQLRENVRDEIKVLAERFRQKYIGYEYT
ncbi:MAG TPA: hypothetical protein DEP38_24295 [Cyanobacteria bacterium UBA9226]|nr:hypothetical protein [Cyanobacteria bacterium UBA9226]